MLNAAKMVQECRGAMSSETGVVKWFSNEKCYGFIQPDKGGNSIFIHKSQLELAGILSLETGQRVKFSRFIQQTNREVAVDLKLLSESVKSHKQRQQIWGDKNGLLKGRVIKFDPEKGFGFIKCDNGTEDVFFHTKTLKQSQIPPEKIPDHRVMFRISPGNKPGTTQAVDIKLA